MILAAKHCTAVVEGYANEHVRTNCLPFTGWDVWVIVVVALVLVAIGLTMRALARRDRP